jgi:hypothetical protein
MNRRELYNYINLCKKCDINIINKLYNDLNIKKNEHLLNEYNISSDEINSVKSLSNNGTNYHLLQNIYEEYYKMTGGKGKSNKGTKGKSTKKEKVKSAKGKKHLKKKYKEVINDEIIATGKKHLKKKYKEVINDEIIATAGVGTGVALSHKSSLINTDIAIIKNKTEELYKNMVSEFSKNNYILSMLSNDINNIKTNIDLILKKINKDT